MKGEDEAFEYLNEAASKHPAVHPLWFCAKSKKRGPSQKQLWPSAMPLAERLIAEGYPVEIIFPEDGTGHMIESISLIAGG